MALTRVHCGREIAAASEMQGQGHAKGRVGGMHLREERARVVEFDGFVGHGRRGWGGGRG